MKRILIFLALILFGLSCEDNSNPVSSSDKECIIGTWKYSNGIIQFCSDSTFIDSVYYKFNYDSISNIEYVISGKYYIDSTILKYMNFNCLYIDSVLDYFIYEPHIYEYKLNDDMLLMKPFDQLDLESEIDSGLYGIWSTIKYQYSYGKKSGSFYSGRKKYTYNFSRDVSYLSCLIEYLDTLHFPIQYSSSYSCIFR